MNFLWIAVLATLGGLALIGAVVLWIGLVIAEEDHRIDSDHTGDGWRN